MSLTKRMIESDPEWGQESQRPSLHWMEQEYFYYLKQREHETISEIEVDFEVVPRKEDTKESTPSLGGDGHN